MTFTDVWKKLCLNFASDLKWFKTAGEEVTINVVRTTRDLGLQVRPQEGTGSLESQHKL